MRFNLLRVLSLLALLPACGSTASLLTPDEFHLTAGRGSGDNEFENRHTDFETDESWVSAGLTWHLNEGRTSTHHQEVLQAMDRMSRSQPITLEAPDVIVTVAQDSKTAPAPLEAKAAETSTGVGSVSIDDFEGNALQYLMYALGLLIATAVGVWKRHALGEVVAAPVRKLRKLKPARPAGEHPELPFDED